MNEQVIPSNAEMTSWGARDHEIKNVNCSCYFPFDEWISIPYDQQWKTNVPTATTALLIRNPPKKHASQLLSIFACDTRKQQRQQEKLTEWKWTSLSQIGQNQPKKMYVPNTRWNRGPLFFLWMSKTRYTNPTKNPISTWNWCFPLNLT